MTERIVETLIIILMAKLAELTMALTLLSQTLPAHTAEAQTIEPPRPEIIVPAMDWRKKIEADPLMKRIATCESGINQDARGKAGEIGVLQFKISTWSLWTKQMVRED